MHGNESFTGRLQSERTKGIGDANVPAGASDLDYAQLPLRWLAPLDVAAFKGRALPSSVAIQPRADRPAQNVNDPFSRSLKAQTTKQKDRPKAVSIGRRVNTSWRGFF
jgi:hypothetical protein